MYQEISEILSKEKFKRKIRWIKKEDVSISDEDIISDLFIYCTEHNKTQINDEFVDKYLKNYRSDKRKNYHVNINDEILREKAEEVYYEIDNKDELIERCNELNLNQEEILCILYARDKINKKRFDYSFVHRANERSVDKNKLCKYYESIILKLLDKIQDKIKS